ncbi:uncharacterized protein LOC116249722 isoform X2 [Nymphaea colorata]|uniref:uncharacterized protein LOC116249722 isoform X2 n=1 Tax=Nymphaea colorata TaxID=210225 RepID=UPI00129D82B3|nr:uncharacterized protein LOC116249722 isoform X2 [Nymphaea colorata]
MYKFFEVQKVLLPDPFPDMRCYSLSKKLGLSFEAACSLFSELHMHPCARNKEIQDLVAARLTSPFSAVQRTRTWGLILRMCWCFLHLLVKLFHLAIQSIHKLQCYFILIGYTFNHVPLGLSKLQSVAIVVDSEEAFQISKVVTLIRWLSKFGVKHISLYDVDGVMKESKKFLVKNWSDLSIREWKEVDKKFASRDQKSVELEWLSFSDGKEAIVKAARYISSSYSKPVELDAHQSKLVILEADVDKALKAVLLGRSLTFSFYLDLLGAI